MYRVENQALGTFFIVCTFKMSSAALPKEMCFARKNNPSVYSPMSLFQMNESLDRDTLVCIALCLIKGEQVLKFQGFLADELGPGFKYEYSLFLMTLWNKSAPLLKGKKTGNFGSAVYQIEEDYTVDSFASVDLVPSSEYGIELFLRALYTPWCGRSEKFDPRWKESCKSEPNSSLAEKKRLNEIMKELWAKGWYCNRADPVNPTFMRRTHALMVMPMPSGGGSKYGEYYRSVYSKWLSGEIKDPISVTYDYLSKNTIGETLKSSFRGYIEQTISGRTHQIAQVEPIEQSSSQTVYDKDIGREIPAFTALIFLTPRFISENGAVFTTEKVFRGDYNIWESQSLYEPSSRGSAKPAILPSPQSAPRKNTLSRPTLSRPIPQASQSVASKRPRSTMPVTPESTFRDLYDWKRKRVFVLPFFPLVPAGASHVMMAAQAALLGNQTNPVEQAREILSGSPTSLELFDFIVFSSNGSLQRAFSPDTYSGLFRTDLMFDITSSVRPHQCMVGEGAPRLFLDDDKRQQLVVNSTAKPFFYMSTITTDGGQPGATRAFQGLVMQNRFAVPGFRVSVRNRQPLLTASSGNSFGSDNNFQPEDYDYTVVSMQLGYNRGLTNGHYITARCVERNGRQGWIIADDLEAPVGREGWGYLLVNGYIAFYTSDELDKKYFRNKGLVICSFTCIREDLRQRVLPKFSDVQGHVIKQRTIGTMDVRSDKSNCDQCYLQSSLSGIFRHNINDDRLLSPVDRFFRYQGEWGGLSEFVNFIRFAAFAIEAKKGDSVVGTDRVRDVYAAITDSSTFQGIFNTADMKALRRPDKRGRLQIGEAHELWEIFLKLEENDVSINDLSDELFEMWKTQVRRRLSRSLLADPALADPGKRGQYFLSFSSDIGGYSSDPAYLSEEPFLCELDIMGPATERESPVVDLALRESETEPTTPDQDPPISHPPRRNSLLELVDIIIGMPIRPRDDSEGRSDNEEPVSQRPRRDVPLYRVFFFGTRPVLTEYVGLGMPGGRRVDYVILKAGFSYTETRDATILDAAHRIISNPFVETQCFLISDNDSTTIMQVIDRLVMADAVMFIGMEAKSMMFVPNTTMQERIETIPAMPYAGDLGRGFPESTGFIESQTFRRHQTLAAMASVFDLEPGAGNRSASETIMRRHQAYEEIIRNMLPDMINEDEEEYDQIISVLKRIPENHVPYRQEIIAALKTSLDHRRLLEVHNLSKENVLGILVLQCQSRDADAIVKKFVIEKRSATKFGDKETMSLFGSVIHTVICDLYESSMNGLPRKKDDRSILQSIIVNDMCDAYWQIVMSMFTLSDDGGRFRTNAGENYSGNVYHGMALASCIFTSGHSRIKLKDDIQKKVIELSGNTGIMDHLENPENYEFFQKSPSAKKGNPKTTRLFLSDYTFRKSVPLDASDPFCEKPDHIARWREILLGADENILVQFMKKRYKGLRDKGQEEFLDRYGHDLFHSVFWDMIYADKQDRSRRTARENLTAYINSLSLVQLFGDGQSQPLLAALLVGNKSIPSAMNQAMFGGQPDRRGCFPIYPQRLGMGRTRDPCRRGGTPMELLRPVCMRDLARIMYERLNDYRVFSRTRNDDPIFRIQEEAYKTVEKYKKNPKQASLPKSESTIEGKSEGAHDASNVIRWWYGEMNYDDKDFFTIGGSPVLNGTRTFPSSVMFFHDNSLLRDQNQDLAKFLFTAQSGVSRGNGLFIRQTSRRGRWKNWIEANTGPFLDDVPDNYKIKYGEMRSMSSSTGSQYLKYGIPPNLRATDQPSSRIIEKDIDNFIITHNSERVFGREDMRAGYGLYSILLSPHDTNIWQQFAGEYELYTEAWRSTDDFLDEVVTDVETICVPELVKRIYGSANLRGRGEVCVQHHVDHLRTAVRGFLREALRLSRLSNVPQLSVQLYSFTRNNVFVGVDEFYGEAPPRVAEVAGSSGAVLVSASGYLILDPLGHCLDSSDQIYDDTFSAGNIPLVSDTGERLDGPTLSPQYERGEQGLAPFFLCHVHLFPHRTDRIVSSEGEELEKVVKDFSRSPFTSLVPKKRKELDDKYNLREWKGFKNWFFELPGNRYFFSRGKRGLNEAHVFEIYSFLKKSHCQEQFEEFCGKYWAMIKTPFESAMEDYRSSITRVFDQNKYADGMSSLMGALKNDTKKSLAARTVSSYYYSYTFQSGTAFENIFKRLLRLSFQDNSDSLPPLLDFDAILGEKLLLIRDSETSTKRIFPRVFFNATKLILLLSFARSNFGANGLKEYNDIGPWGGLSRFVVGEFIPRDIRGANPEFQKFIGDYLRSLPLSTLFFLADIYTMCITSSDPAFTCSRVFKVLQAVAPESVHVLIRDEISDRMDYDIQMNDAFKVSLGLESSFFDNLFSEAIGRPMARWSALERKRSDWAIQNTEEKFKLVRTDPENGLLDRDIETLYLSIDNALYEPRSPPGEVLGVPLAVENAIKKMQVGERGSPARMYEGLLNLLLYSKREWEDAQIVNAFALLCSDSKRENYSPDGAVCFVHLVNLCNPPYMPRVAQDVLRSFVSSTANATNLLKYALSFLPDEKRESIKKFALSLVDDSEIYQALPPSRDPLERAVTNFFNTEYSQKLTVLYDSELEDAETDDTDPESTDDDSDLGEIVMLPLKVAALFT